eukprot:SAG31_NODE_20605_length_569_cov_2.338298_1_plen_115_part_10
MPVHPPPRLIGNIGRLTVNPGPRRAYPIAQRLSASSCNSPSWGGSQAALRRAVHVGCPAVAMQFRCLALLLALVQQSYPATVATKTVGETGNFTARTVFTPVEGGDAAFRIPGIV